MVKRLLNYSERMAYRRLQEACSGRPVRLYTKVRMADAIPIEGSGLPNELFSFALRAHYDFVISTPDDRPLVAVELDGPSHDMPAQIDRDAKKDELSQRFGLPVLRICIAGPAGAINWFAIVAEPVRLWLDRHGHGVGQGAAGWRESLDIPRRNAPSCPACGSAMIEKRGRYGRFLSCIRFPDCRGSLDLETPAYVGTDDIAYKTTSPATPVPSQGSEVKSPSPQDSRPAAECIEQLRRIPATDAEEFRRVDPASNRAPHETPAADRAAYPALFDWVEAILWVLAIPLRLLELLAAAVKAAYRALPDWVEAILWGLGIALSILSLLAGLRHLAKG